MEKEKKKGLFARLADGLTKTRNNIAEKIGSVFSGFSSINADFYEELEEALITADIGVPTVEKMLDELKKRVKEEKVHETEQAKTLLRDIVADMMRPDTPFLPHDGPSVILVVGVNGVGKTTTIGKLAHVYKESGKKVLLCAGDTFRAAAAEQLTVWSQRAGVNIVKHQEGADPAAVVFDGMAAAKARGIDLLIVDTAGRLHNKKNLMAELEKIGRVIEREGANFEKEVLLVLDATTGQNAIAQAKVFAEAAGITGIVLTKLDGTAKGGVAISVKEELGVPVRFVGVGEGMDDLQPFDAEDFASALF
ncbi:MAG: signal recognition particle-docking protein FtsY [Christensenellales bacterium]|jgi:fused signal recognition particle receptor